MEWFPVAVSALVVAFLASIVVLILLEWFSRGLTEVKRASDEIGRILANVEPGGEAADSQLSGLTTEVHRMSDALRRLTGASERSMRVTIICTICGAVFGALVTLMLS